MYGLSGSTRVILVVAYSSLAMASLPAVKAGQGTVIKVATLAPRNSSFMREFERMDKRLRKETGGGVRFKLYASGVSGDEKDMLRKMRTGQLDAAMVTSDGLGLLLPEVNVLRAPGVITTYKQLEAVQKVMLPEFDRAFMEAGFKLVAWGEAGEYRYFSRTPFRELSDIRKMRPWLWPSSPIMKETWRTIGVTPVPLGMREVFGAVQTRMVDLVESTAIAYIALQWHNTDLAYVTGASSGVLVGGWVMNRRAFEGIRPEWRAAMMKLAQQNNQSTRVRTRMADIKAYKRLVNRGLRVTEFTRAGAEQMDKVQRQVRKAMAGRIYSPKLLARVQQIARQSQ
ncbi:MAG: TRAP transporter substrate-binding protein DctP [Myxococcales bacterium]|nr:TRAP transporter substrate-binding protein DctP [Myxococcales bacterium]